jgi:uncharacterized membrane protein
MMCPGLTPRVSLSSHAASTDFYYFAFTLGTSFAVSDVVVTTAGMRWHVMVHSVLSSCYNAVLPAVAIGILTNRLPRGLRVG